MDKIKNLTRVFIKSGLYVLISLLLIIGIMMLPKYLNQSRQASSSCNNKTQYPMRIKKIIAIEGSIAKLQMEDDSIENYIIATYTRSSKGGGKFFQPT